MKFDKILILQQNMLGDVVISTGFVKAMRETFPDSKISFLVSPETAELVRLPFIDEVVEYKKGMPMLPVIKKIWRYDVAFCLDFKYRSALLPFLARIPVRAGLAHKRKLFMTNYVTLDPVESEQCYFNEYMAKILKDCLGVELKGDWTNLYIADATESDKVAVNKFLPPSDELTIAVAPFSSTRLKDLPPEIYKNFIEKIHAKENCRFILIGGKSDAEKDFHLAEGDIDLRGKLSMTQSAEVLRRSNYFIGGCSAPLHMAAAAGTPSLAFYGPTAPEKWAPRHRCIYIRHEQDCSPCDRVGHGLYCNGANTCMKLFTADEVLSAFENLRQKYPLS